MKLVLEVMPLVVFCFHHQYVNGVVTISKRLKALLNEL